MEDTQTHSKQQNKPQQQIENKIIPPRVPSNIMIKSAYYFYNIKEPTYITETILELYQYISQINKSEYDIIEIEAKLGMFLFKGNCVQGLREIKDPMKLLIYDNLDSNYKFYKYDFDSGINENQFYSMWFFANKESEKPESQIKALEPVNYKDTQYKSGSRRSVTYKNGNAVKEEIIHKKDKQHINIRNYGKDFRITACKEEKQFGIANDDAPVGYREKFRVSYKFRYFRLDFTIVSSFKDINYNSAGNKDISYEVEFEFDELKSFLLTENKSFEEFRTMFLRFIQNIFCLYETTSVEYFNNFNALKLRNKDASIFGDYFEKNL